MPYSTKDYNDSIHIAWRKGTPEDPYIDRFESVKIVNQKVVLSEIPDKFFRVRITGMDEVNVDRVLQNELQDNQYIVDYASGFILFHPSKEAITVDITYKGRGLIQYPSNRIYHYDQFNSVVVSLEEIIDSALEGVKHLNESIDGKITDYKAIRDTLLDKISKINIATDNANQASQSAIDATDKALDAFNTTRMLFQPYVVNATSIPQVYPRPEVGWVVQAYDTGISYRWNGINWIPINLFGGNIPDADTNRRGLMSSQTFQQIQNIQSKVDVGKADERVLVFCFPYLQIGVNSIIARFPFDGEIENITGICSIAGVSSNTELTIEKSIDFTNWISVLNNNSYLTFKTKENRDSGSHSILTKNIVANEMFRINVRNLDYDIEGVTIEIKIKIKN